MSEATGRRIVLAGGGTGGHVYPLLAVAEALTDPASASAAAPVEFAWVGSPRSEARLVPQWAAESGIAMPFHQLDIRFSWRRPTPDNWGYYRQHLIPLAFGRPFRQALARLRELAPDLVLASGGYVAAPTLWAAQQLGVPYALVQLDAAPGLVNSHFADGAARIYCAAPLAAQRLVARTGGGRVQLVGFPVRRPRRSAAQVRADYGIESGRRLLIVMGGSLGAGAVLRCASELLAELSLPRYSGIASRLAVLIAAGERGGRLAGQAPAALQCIAVDYIGDSPGALAAADFYIGRAGASTIGELIAAGTASLLLPDPQHADRQQYLNARALAARGQGTLLEQGEAGGAALAQWLAEVWDSPRLPAPEASAAELIAADLHGLLERSA